jgi:hypothetical protein
MTSAPPLPERIRTRRLVAAAIERLELDLSGAGVLTEAATGAFAVTPVIAAAAGAERVWALGGDSTHGSASEAFAQVRELAAACGIADGRIGFADSRESLPEDINLVTNLGFVRPVDLDLLERLRRPAVVSLMYEAWEARDGEVDFAACRRLEVPVAGVHEEFESLGVFSACGQLAVKLCFEAGLEVAGNNLILLGRASPFTGVIGDALRANAAEVVTIASETELSRGALQAADGILVADWSGELVLGGSSGPRPEALAEWGEGLVIVQFGGVVAVEDLLDAGVSVYPPRQIGPRRMAFTLAHLGVRPVVDLHAAGLKVGELLLRGEPFGRYESLVQQIA